ncbi:MAG: efflux transporter periplasmic adaptor subunit, partial [Mesorhizobium sp.]
GKVSARPVATGTRQNGRVAIESGLSEGVSVVVAGAGFLNDGNLVRVAADETKAADAASTAEPAQ